MTGKKGGLLLIEVSVRKNQIKVKGHASLTKKGEDIICAAVSILTQNLVNSIQDLTQEDCLCNRVRKSNHKFRFWESIRTNKNSDRFFFSWYLQYSK